MNDSWRVDETYIIVKGKWNYLYRAVDGSVVKNSSVAKNLAIFQNKWKISQIGKLIVLIRKKMTHEGENYNLKLQKYYFCNGTLFSSIPK